MQVFASLVCIILLCWCKNQVQRLMILNILPGEQHTYKCLSCPFTSMTISQLKEHSLRDHGEVLTLPKLRAANQAAHATLRPPRPASNPEQSPIGPDGMRSCVIFIKHCFLWFVSGWKEQIIIFYLVSFIGAGKQQAPGSPQSTTAFSSFESYI